MEKKMKKSFFEYMTKNDCITYLSVIAVYAIIMVLDRSGNLSYQDKSLLVPVCYSIMLAVSLNMVVGFLGELSLGHAGFMSVGAYVGCIFATQTIDIIPTYIRFPLALLIGGIAAAIFGVIVGVPILRLNGDYLAIVTLAFGEIVKGIIQTLKITKKGPNGEEIMILDGSLGLRTTDIKLDREWAFTIGFVLVMITLFVVLNIKHSKIGRAVMAIRDNRIAAEATGINITAYKLMVFVISAFIAGMAGVLFGHEITTIAAPKFGFNYSIEILVFVVLGGMGKIRGSIIAAALLYIIPVKLSSFIDGGYKTLIYALLLIIMMLLNSNPRFNEFKQKLSPKNLFKKKAVVKEDTVNE
ncbi:MAG: branched-chain amino acid ABC transporter permease [Clostridia bacterium]|nr:branched-chain amino acid ABC transporter permease [Clostridia bacterium]